MVVVRRRGQRGGEREERIAAIAARKVERLAAPARGAGVVGRAGERVTLEGFGTRGGAVTLGHRVRVGRLLCGTRERRSVDEREGEPGRERWVRVAERVPARDDTRHAEVA